MVSQLHFLRLEIIYPELKLNYCILALPCIYYISGSYIDQLQDNVTDVPVCTPRPGPSAYQDDMLMTEFILIWCHIIYAVEAA